MAEGGGVNYLCKLLKLNSLLIYVPNNPHLNPYNEKVKKNIFLVFLIII